MHLLIVYLPSVFFFCVLVCSPFPIFGRCWFSLPSLSHYDSCLAFCCHGNTSALHSLVDSRLIAPESTVVDSMNV